MLDFRLIIKYDNIRWQWMC